ncbi:MAG: hypothetical protein D6675_10435 [Gemmatimonadetes bacterium]|nr:MAG: hypothetical protein D6675_10435 [Gemmatimonadota bacterium]
MTPFKAEITLHEQEGLAVLYGEPMIFHCNHYNLFLQRTIEDAGSYIPAAEILTRGGVVCTYGMLHRLFETHPHIRDPQHRLRVASTIYGQLGFGTLDLSGLPENGGTVVTPLTHYSLGWKEKWGVREQPVDYFTCGFIQAAMAIAYYKTPGFYRVAQEKCLSMGHSQNEFNVAIDPEMPYVPVSVGTGVTIRDATSRRKGIPTQVDEAGITNAVRGIPLEGNADGLIPAFGVYLTRHFANYYNYITYEAARAITNATGEPELARDLFVEAGHVCAVYTFGGIMESDEWYGLVVPQCQTREDWISGMMAVVNALGWGYWTVTELDPGKRMVLRVDGDYESNSYLAMYGKSTRPVSYLVTGGAAGVMNLLYCEDITTKPVLNDDFYDHLRRRDDTFWGVQVKCRAMGDDWCEVEVTPHS